MSCSCLQMFESETKLLLSILLLLLLLLFVLEGMKLNKGTADRKLLPFSYLFQKTYQCVKCEKSIRCCVFSF